jgi:uncharacterized membrane protein
MSGCVIDSHGRSIAKAVSWRMLGTLDTFIISLLVTGSVKWAGSIASVESVSKVILYYLHERAWGKFAWLQRPPPMRSLLHALRRFFRPHQPALATIPVSTNLSQDASQ